MTAVWPRWVGEGILMEVREDFDFSKIDSSSLSWERSWEADLISGEFGWRVSVDCFGGMGRGVKD